MAGETIAEAYVRIRPDTTDFRGDADRDIQAALTDAGGQVRVGADTADARVSIDDVKARLAEIRSTRVAVDVDDARAVAQVELLKADLDKLPDHKNVKVGLDDSSGAGMPGLMAILAGFAPALGTVGVAGAGLGAGLAAGFATAAASAGAFGIVAKTAITDATTAQKNLTTAQTALNKAEQGGNAKTIAVALQNYEKALAAVTPQEQAFTAQLQASESAYKEFSGAVTPLVFSTLESGLKQVTPALAQLPGLVSSVAPAIQGLENDLGGFVASSSFGRFVAFLETEGPKDLTLLGDSFGHMGGLAISALEALAPLTDKVLGSLNSGLGDLQAAVEHGGLNGFVQTAEKDLPIVEKTLGDVAEALLRLGENIAPLGPPLLGVVDGLAHVVDEAEPTVKEIVGGLTPAIKGLGDGLHVLGPLLGPVAVDAGLLFAAFKGWQLVESAATAVKGFATSVGLLEAVNTAGAAAGVAGTAAKTAEMGTEAEAAAGKTGLLSGAIGTLGLAGPVGIGVAAGLGAALVGYQVYATQAADATKRLHEQISTITSKETLDNAASYEQAARSLGDMSAQADIASQKFSVTDGITHNQANAFVAYADAAEKAAEQAQGINTALAILAATSGLTTVQLQQLAVAGGVDLSRPLSQTAGEMSVLGEFSGYSSAQLNLVGKSFQDLHGPAATAETQLQGINELFAAQNLALDYSKSTDTASDALKNLGVVTKNTAATQEQIRQATEGAIAALDQQVTEAKAAGKPLSDQNQIYADGYAQIMGLATGTDTARQATQDLVRNLVTPKEFADQNAGFDQAALHIIGYSAAATTAANNLHNLIVQGNETASLLANGLGVPGIPGGAFSPPKSTGGYTPGVSIFNSGQRRASGGFVDGPFGSPQPILAHGGELVLNPSQQQAVAALGLTGSGTDPELRYLLASIDATLKAHLPNVGVQVGQQVAAGINQGASTAYVHARGARAVF